VTETLHIDDLEIAVRRSARRRTIEITIGRDNAIVVAAPTDVSLDELRELTLGKRMAIYTKLAERAAVVRQSSPKEYVSGEGFYYLGRSHLLKVMPTEGSDSTLELRDGRFVLEGDPEQGPSLFAGWYSKRGTEWLPRPVALWGQRIGVEASSISVRDLGYRWGSCSSQGSLQFHWRLMQLPPRIIEYVVAHELVHLLEPHHSKEFWRLLRRAMPTYEKHKLWLAEHGGDF
jgi:predicted metal-dependent hydrolase